MRNEASCENKHKLVLKIPVITRIGIVTIEPTLTIVIVLNFEHIRITIGISYIWNAILATTL